MCIISTAISLKRQHTGGNTTQSYLGREIFLNTIVFSIVAIQTRYHLRVDIQNIFCMVNI